VKDVTALILKAVTTKVNYNQLQMGRNSEMNQERLLTVLETAERLCLKASTIRRMILERRIDTVRPSARAVRIPENAVTAILKQGFRPAVPRVGSLESSVHEQTR
jgi:excisionase family DNA binding protein